MIAAMRALTGRALQAERGQVDQHLAVRARERDLSSQHRREVRAVSRQLAHAFAARWTRRQRQDVGALPASCLGMFVNISPADYNADETASSLT
eukprot:946911-Rhodomonas_salina.5